MAEHSIIPATHIPRPHPGTFSYITSKALDKGVLVEVSLGRRNVLGLVEQTLTSDAPKPFELKRISRVLTNGPFFPDATMNFLVIEASATLTPLGDIVNRALPPWLAVMKRREQLANISFPSSKAVTLKSSAEVIPVFDKTQARILKYRTLIKKAIRDKKQALIISPSAAGRNALLKAIAGSIPAPQGRLRSSQKLWLDIRQGKPFCIIGGRSALRLPFTSLGIIVIDDEANPLHKETREHPYTDGRQAARILASLHGAKLILGGLKPSIETFHNLTATQKKTIIQLKPPGTIEVIDLNNYRPKYGLSEPLRDELTRLAKKTARARALIYVNRKGKALALSCADCDFTFSCVNCDAPMPVYKAGDVEGSPEDIAALRLKCRHCGEVFIPPLACPSCRGLRLVPRGYAGAGIEQSISIATSSLTLFRLDGDTAKTPAKRIEILTKFKNHSGPAVLIATTMALTEELPKFDLIAVPSFDRLSAIPDFRAEEAAWRHTNDMRNRLKTNGRMLLQTWHPKSDILKFVTKNDYIGLAKKELKLRQTFAWPPFSRIAKLSYSNSNALEASSAVAEFASELERVLPTVDVIGPSPAFIPRIKNQHAWNIILRWKPKNNMDFKVEEKLWDILPSTWDADVAPISIL